MVSLFLYMLLLACTGTPDAPLPCPDTRLDDLRAAILDKMEDYRARHDLPGVSLGFVLKDGRACAVTAGLADREAARPLSEDDRLLSGSVGKTYVAAVALQLAAERKLDLDAPISRWLGNETWFERLPNGRDVLVRMLMNHTSGIPEHVYHPDIGKAVSSNPDRVWKPEELVGFILDSPPLFEAGKGWRYADANYIVLGMIIEKVAGRSYYGELERRILGPLGLDDTVPADSRTIPGLAPGYAGPKTPFLKTGRTIRDGKFVFNPQLEWTGGGLACTARDLARWAHAVYRGKAFPAELMQEVLDGKTTGWAEGDRYGLGVQIWPSPLGECVGHGGWFPGYLSLMAHYRDLEVSIAIQTNSDDIPKSSNDMRLFLNEIAALLAAEKPAAAACAE